MLWKASNPRGIPKYRSLRVWLAYQLGFAMCLPVAAAAQTPPAAANPETTLRVNSSFLYLLDNRDTRPHQVASRLNDHWGMLYTRYYAQAYAGVWRLNLRADHAWFYTAPNPTQVAIDMALALPEAADRPGYFRQKLAEAGIERSSRFINWFYPAKYSLSYSTPDFELTLGDSRAVLGSGLVLSLRQQAELLSDNSVRGIKLQAKTKHVSVTALYGVANPLRVDEASGRYLGAQSASLSAWQSLWEGGMPRATATDFAPNTDNCSTSLACNYAPDQLAAAQIRANAGVVELASQGSLLSRSALLGTDPARRANAMLTFSNSVQIRGPVTAYAEFAQQHLSSTLPAPRLDPGHALLVDIQYQRPQFSASFQGKHYRRFFPLSPSIAVERAREFVGLSYNAPPTTETPWLDSAAGALNTCVSGGRAKFDWAVRKTSFVFAWLGHYRSYAESVSNDNCEATRANENQIWDSASGFETRSTHTHANVTLGVRVDQNTEPRLGTQGSSQLFYSEGYARYQLTHTLSPHLNLQLVGWHRRRDQRLGGPGLAFWEGDQLLSLSTSSGLSLGFGFEYSTNPQLPPTYFNGQLAYRISSDKSVALFFGQRRGAERCNLGVCRFFPAFEGLRIDANWGF